MGTHLQVQYSTRKLSINLVTRTATSDIINDKLMIEIHKPVAWTAQTTLKTHMYLINMEFLYFSLLSSAQILNKCALKITRFRPCGVFDLLKCPISNNIL
jgi:hypothetical protein